jgi:hypothetical protein
MLKYNRISDCWKNFNDGKVEIYPNSDSVCKPEVRYNWLEFVSGQQTKINGKRKESY